MSTYRDMVDAMTEQVIGSAGTLDEDKRKIEALWNRFLHDMIDIGYLPKPNEILNVRSVEGSKHDAGARVSLETPSKRELEKEYGIKRV